MTSCAEYVVRFWAKGRSHNQRGFRYQISAVRLNVVVDRDLSQAQRMTENEAADLVRFYRANGNGWIQTAVMIHSPADGSQIISPGDAVTFSPRP